MNKTGVITGITLSAAVYLSAFGQDENQGKLDSDSTGFINMNLVITEDMSAGFLKSGLATRDARFREMVSTRLIQTIRQESDVVLPFCIMSSGGGFFEVTKVDMPGGERDAVEDVSRFAISFGDLDADSARYRSLRRDECNITNAIPVTIHLNGPDAGEDLGTIYGKINLLVKTE